MLAGLLAAAVGIGLVIGFTPALGRRLWRRGVVGFWMSDRRWREHLDRERWLGWTVDAES